MEDVNAALKAADDIVDCSMIQKMSWFKERIEASGMFMLDNLRLNLSNNEKYGTVVIPMKRQNLMEEVMDVIRESIKVNILYTVNSEKGRRWRTVAYSMPYNEDMYILGMQSDMYGVVEEIDVTFFQSIDVMFAWLRDNLEAMQNYNGVFLHKQETTELYRIFM